MKNFIFFIILIICFGCTNSYAEKNLKTYMLEEENFYQIYKNSDINSAEKALIGFENVILNYEKEEIEGIDYNKALGHLYIKFHLLETQKGSKEKANQYLQRAIIKLLNGKRASQNEIDEAKERLVKFHYKADCKASVKWLKCVDWQ